MLEEGHPFIPGMRLVVSLSVGRAVEAPCSS